VLAAALLFSTGGAAIKSISLGGWQVAGLRSLVAGAAVLVVFPDSRKKWNLRVLGTGAAYAATLILFVQANKLTTAAHVIFLQSTAPFYLLLAGPWLLSERLHRADLRLLVPVAIGMLLFFAGQPALPTAPDPTRGNLLALAAGVSWALTLAGIRHAEKTRSPAGSGMGIVAAGNLMAALFCLPVMKAELPPSTDLALLVYLGVVQVALAYVFLTRGLRVVPALEGSLLLLVEPAMNPLWAFLVHHEKPSAAALAGGMLVLGASLVKTLSGGRRAA